jgi:HAD superfamily hydrolase (TIGR01509 family)
VIDTIIFDLDGVLVDSEPIMYASTNAVLFRRDTFLEREDYDRCRGMGEEEFFALLAERFGLDEAPTVLARERMIDSLNRMAAETLLPMPGALTVLLKLVGEGYRMAVASASRRPHVELVVEKLGIRRLMGAVVCLDDVSRGKPEPDLFLEAARRLGAEPASCLVVEDAVLGVQAARRAGMRAVALPAPDDDGARHLEVGALACLQTLEEMTPEALDTWGDARADSGL